MPRRLTGRIFTTLAILAFGGANGLTASGLQAVSRTAETASEIAAMSGQAEHHAADHRTGDQGHDHGAPEECSCFGTCASVTPPLVPISRAPSVGFDATSADRPSWDLRSAAPRLTAYLFPLPNAPPVRA